MLQLFVQSYSFDGTKLINVKQNGTIHDIKLQIEAKTGIPSGQQRLITFGSKMLSDQYNVSYYNIQNEQTLVLQVSESYYVKVVLDEKTNIIECDQDDTILKIKQKLESTQQIPIEHQTLYSTKRSRSALDNDKTLSFYQIQSTAPLYLLLPDLKVIIQTLNEKKWILNAKGIDTIHTLKLNIEKLHGISLDEQALFLNDQQMNDDGTLYSYKLKSDTVIKLVFLSYLRYKQKQQSITNATNTSMSNAAEALTNNVENLNAILPTSRNQIHNTSSLSSLTVMTPTLFSRISSEVNKISTNLNVLKQRSNDAKKSLDFNYNNAISYQDQAQKEYTESIKTIGDNIDDIEKQIEKLKRKWEELMQLKKSKKVFYHNIYDRYKDIYQTIRNENMNEVDTKINEVEAIYYRSLENDDHETQLKEILEKKRVFFEKYYEKWDVPDTIAWIKNIQNGYFNDKRFEKFINLMTKMKIDGMQLHEINNKLFLKTAVALEQEKDQYILRKNINRIVKHQNDISYQNICGLCAENTINTVMIPCGHCYCCFECTQNQQMAKCPICRKNVVQIIQTYMSGFSKINQ